MQYSTGVVTKGAPGLALTVTVIDARSLSQPFTVWLTYQVDTPATVVETVGVAVLPDPPVDVEYHLRFCPVTAKGFAVSNWQYVIDEVTEGAAGLGITVATIGVLGPSQAATDWLTYQVKVPAEEVEGIGAVGLPEPPVADVYQSRFWPVATSGIATANWQ